MCIRDSNYALQLIDGTLIPLLPQISDSTGQISYESPATVILGPGYYLISYGVSAILRTEGYMQITPFYNSAAHLDQGIYFKTGSDSSSATGSTYFILYTPAQTRLNFTFNSPVSVIEGEISLTIVKLRRNS